MGQEAGAATEQLELLRSATKGRRPKPPEGTTETLPVARVVVDVPLPHLDRTFDYTVPASMADAAQPGVRVKVRFAGQDVDGYLLERAAASDHAGRLAPLRRVVSPESVLAPEVLRLARAVADRYAGTLTDVLRLAIPPRHARVEAEAPAAPPEPLPPEPLPPDGAPDAADPAWADYPAGPALLARLAAGDAPRAVWTALPGPGWAPALAAAVRATLRSGRGALLVLPDSRDVDICCAALAGAIGPDRFVRLEADLGPAPRYRAFLALRRGTVRVAVGTRAAAFAPVQALGLVAIWDDGDDLHAEPRAPYPHAREVLALRAEQAGAALIAGGWARTAECAAWLRTGWARPVTAPRPVLRTRWPAVRLATDGPGAQDDPGAAGRLPVAAWRAMHDGLTRGPVLVQVPRAGYLPGMACQSCRRSARCPACHGPVALPVGTGDPAHVAHAPACRWCGRAHPGWTCPHCGGRRLRARAVGVLRTAEELGRAFPGARVIVPRAGAATPQVPERALVVATPGLEPPVPEGYAAAVLLDGSVLLERPDLRASEDALRRWSAAAALVRPAPEGGLVVLSADPQAPAVQALVRADPGGHADRELDERAALGLPPAVALATVTGDPAAVGRFLELAELPADVETLGPLPVGEEPDAGAPAPGGGPAAPGDPAPVVRLVLRAGRDRAAALSRALHDAAARRSAKREPGTLHVRVDPREIG